jgi:signal transduction histidine kinase/DNA-binding NarL/FixJ family response regulator
MVLLVEDNPSDAQLMALRLECATNAEGSRPIYLRQAGSVAEACESLATSSVDAVILDLTLPDARGLEALHRVRESSPRTPVIVLTAIADETVALASLRSGAQDYLLKPPPDGNTIARIIRYAVERQRLIQALDAALSRSASSERKARTLADVSAALAISHDFAVAITGVSKILVPAIADSLVLVLSADDEVPVAAEQWHVDGAAAPSLRDRARTILASRGVGTSSPIDWEAALQRTFASLGLSSAFATAICIANRERGVLILASSTPRRDVVIDHEFVGAIGDRIGIALQQYRLFRQTQLAVAARDRAVSIVSHDLRNPLTTIQICANALMDPAPAPPSGVRHMGALIQRSAALMQEIAQDLLDHASLDSGGFLLHRKPTSVAAVLGTLQLVFEGIAKERSLELFIDSGADLPLMDADEHRLVQALSNLLSNALKFTPSGGHIDLRAYRGADASDSTSASKGDDGAVRFVVRDTGPGIPPEDIGHVFDWFWKASRDQAGGAGIGLAIAKGLVEAHQSRLHVESGPGQGSTFWFTIPAAGALQVGLVGGGMMIA